MRIISAPDELRNAIKNEVRNGRSVGFVPTMGALHDGHLSLVHRSELNDDVTVVSIFVNPLQFNNSDDLERYPRVLDEDLKKLENRRVDYVFTPSVNDLYPTKPIVSIDFGMMSSVMEGKFRKGHFEGVGLVVSKLFHMVQADRAYFGKKDLQQLLIIKKMCDDFNFPVEVIGVDTVREKSGLAMSSRNRQLSQKGMKTAANLHRGLILLQNGIQNGIELNGLIEQCNSFYAGIENLTIEYLEAVNAENLQPIKSIKGINELAVCVAGYVEGVRLIDNLYLRLK